jgi:hypothetical protein
MPGHGSSAHLIETDSSYLCSRCRSEVSPNATACPHCGRNIGDSSAPFVDFLMSFASFLFALGIISLVLSGISFVTGFSDGVPVFSFLGLVIIIFGLVVLTLTWLWDDKLYPVVSGITYGSIHFVKLIFNPITVPMRWVLGKLR